MNIAFYRMYNNTTKCILHLLGDAQQLFEEIRKDEKKEHLLDGVRKLIIPIQGHLMYITDKAGGVL